jgi:hypothetical protein
VIEADQNEIGQQGIEQLLALEETREASCTDDDSRLCEECLLADLTRQFPDHGPVAEVQPRLNALNG